VDINVREMVMRPIEETYLAAPLLRGRCHEHALIAQLLAGVRAGGAGAVVVRGEAGIGKTTLLEHAACDATGFRIAHVAGVPSEMRLTYAGLHQLCAPMLDRLKDLPEPQADVLRVAFGMSAGDPPGRFLVGLATLNLVAATAREQPLLCLVDDLQWLDEGSAQILGFVARRLAAERVAMVFAVREPGEQRALRGIAQLRLEGLSSDDARALFSAALAGPLDPHVRDRIVTETRGNPHALLELARRATPAELAGGFAMLGGAPSPDPIERSLRRRLDALPSDSRRLVLLAAADPVGEPTLIWRGADELEIPFAALAPAAAAGLLEVGAKVHFLHPLVRLAAYRSASPHERHVVHHALARVTDPERDPDRRAWHLAQATVGPDEEIAVELERSATCAQRRGGLAAAAAFLERAAALSPERPARAVRVLAAAACKRDAGALESAVALLSAVDRDALDEAGRARLQTLQGQIAFDQRRGPEATRLLADAARRLEPLAPEAARRAHLEALGAAIWVGDQDGPAGARELARAILQTPAAPEALTTIDRLADGLARLLADGFRAAAPSLTGALELALTADAATEDREHWQWLTVAGSAVTVPQELWEDEAWHTLARRRERFARDTGSLVQLQFALHMSAFSYVMAGQMDAASLLVDEDRSLALATGNPPLRYTDTLLAAFRGSEDHATELIDATAAEATERGLGKILTFARYASAVLDNGRGRYAQARDVIRPAFDSEQPGYGPFVVPELADRPLLARLLEWIGERTELAPSDWSLGIEARIGALLADDGGADVLYERSLEHLGRTRIRTELARTHLLYGEWLRRRGRRVDAREQLRIAHELLHDMGMAAFAERARRELVATGATVRRRIAETRDDLTAQEREIAQLARDGLSNPDIGARLFLSPRTVEWHLRKVFGKLGISSRRGLPAALTDGALQAAAHSS
jgi:DNA-binding CsgD family transcriptional regulator